MVHAACPAPARGRPSSTYDALVAIPDVRRSRRRSDHHQPPARGAGVAVVGGRPRSRRSSARHASPASPAATGRIVHCTEKAREAMFGFVVARWPAPAARGAPARRRRRLVQPPDHVGDAPRRPAAGDLRVRRRTAVDGGLRPGAGRVALNGSNRPLPTVPAATPTSSRRARARADVQIVVDRRPPQPRGRATASCSRRSADVVERGAAWPRSSLVVGTDGTPDDRSWATELRAGRRSGIAEHVRFLGFRDDASRAHPGQRRLRHAQRRGAVRARVPRGDGGGHPGGRATIGGTPEVVVDGVTGLLSAPGDVAGLAAQPRRRCSTTPSCASGSVPPVSERVAEHFGADRMAADVAGDLRRGHRPPT